MHIEYYPLVFIHLNTQISDSLHLIPKCIQCSVYLFHVIFSRFIHFKKGNSIFYPKNINSFMEKLGACLT